MKTMLTRSGREVSRYSVASVDMRDECSEIVRRAVAAVRTAPRGSRSSSLQDMESAFLNEAKLERPVTLERFLRFVLLGREAGADLSDVASAFAEILAPDTETLPASLAEAIDNETEAQCEADPIEVRARAGLETVRDYDELIGTLRPHRDSIVATLKVATREKLRLLRGGVSA